MTIFNWTLESTPQIIKLQEELLPINRQVFFAAVDEEKNLGFEVVDLFVFV